MSRNLVSRLGFSLPLCLCLAASALAAERSGLTLAAASITREELKTYIDVLADDTFEGREAGSRGGRAAGNYLYKALEQYGASPAGDSGTYFQTFSGASRNLL